MSEGTVDAHHHIWRQADLPWLSGPMLPRIFGPYEAIRRDYPISEYLADIAGSGVTRSIYVQANWAKEHFEEEAAFVQKTAEETGWPHAVVAYADMMAKDVRPQLDRLKRYSLVRGIRMQLHWHENQLYRFAAQPDLMRDEIFRRNMDRLADYDLTFDLQIFTSQMDDGAALARDFPKVRFILQHAGMLEDLSALGRAAWRDGMRKLAGQRNVYAKLSGLGTFIHNNDATHIARIVGDTISLFGSARCLFGSNFPIEKLWTDYASLIGAYRKAMAGMSQSDRDNVFRETAMRVYRIG
jgi:predicted TIM-barrel fold metal-dependent hydrolase